MKCILHIIKSNQSEITIVGETLKAGQTHIHNGEEYLVKEIVIEPNQKHPILYCNKVLPKKERKPLVTTRN
jgi:hypothetical protein